MVKKERKTYIDMTQGAPWRAILVFALPIMLGQLLQQLYQTVDGIVVGNVISSGALAAVGTCTSVTMVFLAFSIGMGGGSGILISQLFGAGRKSELRSAAANIILLMFVLGLAVMVLGVLGADFISRVILRIEDEEIRVQAATYLRIYSVGLIFTFLYNAVSSILRAVGDSKAMLYFLIVSTVLNTVLDLLFVKNFGLGVAGAAWATVIAQGACMAVSYVYMFRLYPDFRFSSPRQLRPDWAKLGICVRLGLPTTLQFLIISGGHLVLQRLVNSFGSVTMAAVTVGQRYDHYCSIPSFGMMQAMSSFTGQNIGAGHVDRVKQGVRACLIMSFSVVVLICIAMYIFAAPLAELFGVEGETLKQSVEYMRYLAFAFPIFALYIPLNGTFQGAGAPMASAGVSLCALAVRVGAAYLLVGAFQWGYAACWQTYGVGWLASLVVALIYYLSGKWQFKAVARRVEEEEP